MYVRVHPVGEPNNEYHAALDRKDWPEGKSLAEGTYFTFPRKRGVRELHVLDYKLSHSRSKRIMKRARKRAKEYASLFSEPSE